MENTTSGATSPVFEPQVEADGSPSGFDSAGVPSTVFGTDHYIDRGDLKGDGSFVVWLTPAGFNDSLTLDDVRSYLSELTQLVALAESELAAHQ